MTFDRHPYLKHSTAAPYMPAHKDIQRPAGQIRPTEQELKGQQNLSDYIRSINRAQAFDDVAQEKKLTLDEWTNKQWPNGFENYERNLGLDDLLGAWMFAIKHGKVS